VRAAASRRRRRVPPPPRRVLSAFLLPHHFFPLLADISRIHVWAPEIKAAREEGLFSFHPCPPVARETVRDRQFSPLAA
jgi:hypothetical protein